MLFRLLALVTVCLCGFASACRGPTSLDANDPVGNKASSSPDSSTVTSGAAKVVVVTGTAPSDAENRTVTATLVDATGRASSMATATVRSGAFSVSLDNTQAESNAKVALFIDINGDTVCDIAPTDIGSLVNVALTGNASVMLDANAQAPCHAFGDYNFTVSGSDFTPHNNQMIYAALRDTKSNAFVTVPQGVKVNSGVWKLVFAGALVKGRAYELRYFADLAASGVCQNHSWVATVQAASADASLVVSHDTAQTAICTNFPALSSTTSP